MKKFLLFFLLSIFPLLATPIEFTSTPLKISFVLVGDPQNKEDKSYGGRGLGTVNKKILIGKYEITAGQYCSFLTAVTSYGDPHHLYKEAMSNDPHTACIKRTQLEDGSYQYDLIDDIRGMLPITYVTLPDAERFCNWLENDAPTCDTSSVLLAESTEKGAYQFIKQDDKEYVRFNPKAHYYIPTENEWVKAAYYKGGGTDQGYWNYPTQHDSAPNNGHGDVHNQANYETLASHWSSPQQNPNLTPVDFFSKTMSFYGVCDMGGNVAEWTCHLGEEDNALSDPLDQEMVRGGSWKSQYSIWYDNDLLRNAVVSPNKTSFIPSTATNFIGFRIAASIEIPPEPPIDSNTNNSPCYEVATSTSAFIIWTFLKGIIFGCPRTMIQTITRFFGYDAASLLGINDISAISFKLMLSIAAIDLVGYIAIMAAGYALYYFIPWSFIRDYTLATFDSFLNLL